MLKGYLIGHVTISDEDAYAAYVEAAQDALRPFNSRIVAGGKFQNLEGEAHQRHVIFEFDSFAEAVRFYESEEYQTAKALRDGAAVGTFVVLEGNF